MTTTWRWLVLTLLLQLGLMVGQAAAEVDPLDWPNWRGPEQNGITREKGLVTDWSPKKGGKNLQWVKEDISSSSSPIVMNGKLYMLSRHQPETPNEMEKVVCLDAETGETLWEHMIKVYLTDVPSERVSWSCVAGDPEANRVYALGVCGAFFCLDGESGQVIWKRSLSEEFGLLSTYGGRTNVPILFDNLVIISGVCINWGDTQRIVDPGLQFDPKTGGRLDMAKPAHRFLAFNKETGEVAWFSGTKLLPEDTTYSTPFLTAIQGQAVMIFGGGDGAIYAMQPRTGKIVWKFNMSPRGINISPIVADGHVFVGQSEENWDDTTMGAVAAIDPTLLGDITQKGEQWRAKEIMVGKSSPVYQDGKLYVASDGGQLFVLDAETGDTLQEERLQGANMRSSLIIGDGKLYACTINVFHVFEITDDGLELMNRVRLPIGSEMYGTPIVSHGRFYIPTSNGLFCIGEEGVEPSADPLPEQPQESPASDDMTPALIQLTPAELLLSPGDEAKFSAKLFNANGQYVGEAEGAALTVEGPGSVSADGTFVANSDAGHSAAYVTAKLGELSTTSRVRIVPPLPWTFDFEDGQIPISWVGVRYRHQPRELEGEKVLTKITTIPKGTRSQGWMGQPELSNYTIQADIRGGITAEGKRPDIGLIAQRYTLDLMGASQQLQIRSWTSQLNVFSKTIEFPWKPNTWYTMKFQATVDGEDTVLRGKIWVRGEDEPEDWTIEARDVSGNQSGSPGLFGNASNAEIYLDNISVTPN